MAKGPKGTESVIASVAEWDEQAGEEVQASRKVANVGTKRSDPTLATKAGGAVVPVDLASDSGYSSRTQATSASADSAASIRAKIEQAGALQERRLAPEDGSVVSQKSGSTASSKPKKKRQCAEPNCDKCIAARAKHAEEVARKAARQQKLSVNTNVSPVKSREESPVKQPHSGAIVRQKPAVHQQDSAHPVPRRRDSQQARERPSSMYDRPPPPMGGPPQSAGPYGRPDPRYPYPADPRAADPRAMMVVGRSGPPMSARGGGPVGGRGRPVYNVAPGALPSARRPQPSTVVVADNRPQVDNREAKMKQQLAAAQRMQQAKQPHVNEEEFDDEEEDDEEDYSDEEEEEDYEDYEDEQSDDDVQGELLAKKMMRERMRRQSQVSQDQALAMQLRDAHAEQARLEKEHKRRVHAQAMVAEQQRRQRAQMGQMPPPPPPPPPGHSAAHMPDIPQTPGGMYSMRRAQPQITYPDRRPSQLDPMDADFRSSLRSMTPGPSGSSANRRPSLASSGGTKATSYSGPNAYPHTTVESRTGRRMSYMGTEPRQQLENMHHGFEQSQLERIVSAMVQNALAQNTATEEPRTVNFAMDDQLRSAMKYQSRVDHVGQHTRRDTLTDLPHIPQQLTAAALRRQAGIPSQSGSSRSYRTSDDDPSLISAGHRLTGGSEAGDFTVNGDEMKVRIDTSNGFQMEFDGRLVVLNPIGDGSTAELIIGGKGARGTTSYHGSQATRSVINRQPSQRQRRPTYEDDDDRTERRTVYRRDDRRREREEREAEERAAEEAEIRRRVRRERRAREEAKLNEAERRAAKAERKAQKARKDHEEAQRRQRNARYDTTEVEDEDHTSSETDTSEDDRRTQRTARRRAKTETDRRPQERRRAPVRNSGGYDYPPGYAQKAGFDQSPAF